MFRQSILPATKLRRDIVVEVVFFSNSVIQRQSGE